jgi:hypothetical protein
LGRGDHVLFPDLVKNGATGHDLAQTHDLHPKNA